ncbi:hypothetical protein FQN57_005121 [Myotisia sp. PD_48]|nr:hypothetical protein FQN57_005121 [Myotisia sp. PD_48]
MSSLLPHDLATEEDDQSISNPDFLVSTLGREAHRIAMELVPDSTSWQEAQLTSEPMSLSISQSSGGTSTMTWNGMSPESSPGAPMTAFAAPIFQPVAEPERLISLLPTSSQPLNTKPDHSSAIDPNNYVLTILQQPERVRTTGNKEKERRTLEPPPVIQLTVRADADPEENYKCSPYHFMCCTLYHATEDRPADTPKGVITGNTTSSLYRIKHAGEVVFIFEDYSIKVEGKFRLKFSLFELINCRAHFLSSVMSDPFRALLPKDYVPSIRHSSPLSLSLFEQGVRLRVRKTTRTSRKRSMPANGGYSYFLPPDHPFLRPSGYPAPIPSGSNQISPSIPSQLGSGLPTKRRKRLRKHSTAHSNARR